MLKVDRVWVRRGSRFALENISLSLPPGKTLAIVGESGAGKSTLIATILGLLKPRKGDVTWADHSVRACGPALVMQEPRAAFNPALSLRRSVMEPIVARNEVVPHERIRRLSDSLELSLDILDRCPGEISIGQAQRLAILRALMTAPPLVLLDEPLSALDAATQKRTARLISDLQREERFAAMVVTHDLGYAVAHADEIAVIKSGRIEEVFTPQTFAMEPKSAYCRSLRDAAIALGALEEPV
ncbi:MAG: ATP-binding cassette domain-containing protein [Rhodobacteraceae bacterium]|nr:ATP-binding cassette domain-containing protein [Paracoccaceae bacterium]